MVVVVLALNTERVVGEMGDGFGKRVQILRVMPER